MPALILRITSVEAPMNYNVKLADCQGCQQERAFRQHRPNHLMHGLLTIFLGGLWLPVWALATFHRGPYRCPACGTKYVKPPKPWSPFFLLFGVLVVLLALVALFRGFSHEHRIPRSVSPPAPVQEIATFPTTLTATALQQTFRATPKTAEARYSDTGFVVSGEAKLVVPAEKERQSWLVFVSGDGESVAQCVVDE